MKMSWFQGRWEKSAAVIAAAVGVILIVVGWIGVSGSSLTTEQLPYLASGAIGGLFVLGVGATLWLSSDLRDEYYKLDQIWGWMQEQQTAEPPEPADNGVPAPARRARSGSR
jgi:protein-S-isoprenylcysteine O-methyltransferase Ste14